MIPILSRKLKLKLLKILPLIGIYNKNQTEDRVILEKIIFPYFISNLEYQKIIFMGVAWYTMEYNKLFKRKEFWTIDFNPKMKIYGSKRHLIDSIENLDKYFEINTIDLIICNGLIGYGLSDQQIAERAFKICHNILRKNGIFIIGWNDLPKHRPIVPEEIEALKLFTPFHFQPLNSNIYVSESNRHTYVFYIKAETN